MPRTGWWRVLPWLFGIAVVAFAARRIATQWTALGAAPVAFELHPLPLLGAACLVWAAYGILVAAWRMMVHALGSPLTLAGAARVWTVSSLGKYLPGKIWAVAGMAVLAREAGASPVIATASALLQQLVGLASGVVLVLVLGRGKFESHLPGGAPAVWALAAGALVALAVALSVPVRTRLLALLSAEAAEAGRHAVPWFTVVLSLLANLTAWAGYGTALWLLAAGLLPAVATALGPVRLMVAFTGAYVAGVLAFVVPGGLGVREGALVAALTPSIGGPAALALAVAARVLFTVTELGAAAPFVLLSKEKVRVVV